MAHEQSSPQEVLTTAVTAIGDVVDLVRDLKEANPELASSIDGAIASELEHNGLQLSKIDPDDERRASMDLRTGKSGLTRAEVLQALDPRVRRARIIKKLSSHMVAASDSNSESPREA